MIFTRPTFLYTKALLTCTRTLPYHNLPHFLNKNKKFRVLKLESQSIARINLFNFATSTNRIFMCSLNGFCVCYTKFVPILSCFTQISPCFLQFWFVISILNELWWYLWLFYHSKWKETLFKNITFPCTLLEPMGYLTCLSFTAHFTIVFFPGVFHSFTRLSALMCRIPSL